MPIGKHEDLWGILTDSNGYENDRNHKMPSKIDCCFEITHVKNIEKPIIIYEEKDSECVLKGF